MLNCKSAKSLPQVKSLFASLALVSLTLTNAYAQQMSAGNSAVTVANTPLIPRAALFGNPVKAGAQISPNGKWLSWLAPVNG